LEVSIVFLIFASEVIRCSIDELIDSLK